MSRAATPQTKTTMVEDLGPVDEDQSTIVPPPAPAMQDATEVTTGSRAVEDARSTAPSMQMNNTNANVVVNNNTSVSETRVSRPAYVPSYMRALNPVHTNTWALG